MKYSEKIRFFGKTDVGRQRTNNEDAFVVEQLDENTVLAVVIDGIGGYEGGEVAAEIAKIEIPSYLKEFNRGERLELLKQAVVCANNAIYDRRRFDTARPHMGCVLTSALIDANRKVIDMVHVGDTRLYQFHQGNLRKLSHDHSYVGYCEENDELTLFAVNRTLDKDVDIHVDVRSFGDMKLLEHIVLENDDLKAVNSSEKENVKPSLSKDTKVEDGTLTGVLHRASWNVIRLGKR